ERLADPAIPADDRRAITAVLDAAAAEIGPDMALPSLAGSYTRVLAGGTDFLRVQSKVLVAQVQEAVARASAETSDASVSAVMATDPPTPHDAPEQRAAWAGRVFAAWRGLIDGVPDVATRQDFDRRLDEIEALRAKSDLKAISAPYKEFLQAWTDYGLRRIQDAAHGSEAAFCRNFGADLRRTLTETEANMRLITESPGRRNWEAAIDRIRLHANSVPDETCLDVNVQRKAGTFAVEQKAGSPLFDLRAEANSIARDVFTAALNATPLPGVSRLDAAERSGVPQAIALARQLLSSPRSLTLATEPSVLRTGQAVRFDVSNLDPAWGPGVLVAINYGDRTVPEQRSAEEVRKIGFVHRYDAPLPTTVKIAAATGFQPQTLEASDQVLGTGSLSIKVEDAPWRPARALADTFINARFALAVAVALLVYVWQFQEKRPDFGRRGLDYVMAFALGFAVQAAATNLTEALSKMTAG
ncbi:MAG: hypothetical protein JO110_05830, partial [Acetobacteraceae bacterium]|nr:hypothetical protein [Acetobacteraceae bacterium]